MSAQLDVRLVCAPFREGEGDSRALLLAAAEDYLGHSPGAPAIGPWGKPEFPDQPQLHCSVTHSGNWWMCALAQAPVGLDLQLHSAKLDLARLSRRFFHPLEDAFLAANDYRDFFPLWSAKESWVKFTGRGFRDDPATFSVVSPGGDFPAMPGAVLRLLPFSPAYSLCLCAATPCTVRIGMGSGGR